MNYTSVDDLSDEITGTGGTSYAWDNTNTGDNIGNGTLSSTTGNIYGIYDMAGCLADYTATYVNAEESSNLLANGVSLVSATSTFLATAYPYNPLTTDYKDFNSGYNGIGWNKIFGDAIYETSSGTGAGKVWFGQTFEEDTNAGEVFMARGGHWNDLVDGWYMRII